MNEDEIKASYDSFTHQINQDSIKNELRHIKILNIISAITGIYAVLTFIEDLEMEFEILNPIIGFACAFVSIILVTIGWSRRLRIDNAFRETYKSTLEACLNIEIDDDDSEDQKFPASEYKKTEFKHYEDTSTYYYSSTSKITMDKKLEAYHVEMEGNNDIDEIDDWVIKQKTNIKGKHIIKDTKKIVEKFNEECGYNTQAKVEISINDGNLYILMDIDLFFWYSFLVEYSKYKTFYSNLRLMADFSKYVNDNINSFIKLDN